MTHIAIPRVVTLLAIVGIAVGSLGKPPRVSAQQALPDAMQVLGWLPSDTETVVVTKGPYKLKWVDPDQRPRDMALAKQLEGLSYMPLAIRKGKFVSTLAGQEVTLAVEGARRFRSPKGLGLSLYHGCHILVFRHELGTAADSLRKAFAGEVKKNLKLGDHEVFSVEEKLEEDTWTFFFAQPKPNILLCATNQDYLSEVLQRMSKPGEKRAFPTDLPEWKHVDTSARFWAIRHYGKQRRKSGVDSAFLTDPKAIGMIFTFNPGERATDKVMPKITYLSGNNKAVDIARKEWTYFDRPTWRPTVQEKAAGVVEITAVLQERENAEFLYLLLFHLGHAIAL